MPPEALLLMWSPEILFGGKRGGEYRTQRNSTRVRRGRTEGNERTRKEGRGRNIGRERTRKNDVRSTKREV